MKKRTKERDILGVNAAPKSHRELIAEAKKKKFKSNNKYWCQVNYETTAGVKQKYIIEAPSKAKIKISQLKHTHKHKNCAVTFSEIHKIVK